LKTPALKLAYQPDGFYGIEIEGFETRSRRLGAPDIPTATFLVAIPPQTVPRLEVRACVEQARADVRPRPVPRTRLSLSPEDERELAAKGITRERRLQILRRASRPAFEADSRVYQGTTPYPEQVA